MSSLDGYDAATLEGGLVCARRVGWARESEQPMEIISVTPDNIDAEHICCAITEKRGESCVSQKKVWMSERFADGLVFRKLDARGKVFIEYIPAEKAWCPIEADGYLHIDCFWVSGQYKGRGHATELLEACIADAREQGKLGITALSSAKKMPFLSDPKFLRYKGFETADTAEPFYELLYLPFSEDAPVPRFMSHVKKPRVDEDGFVLYFTNQCPFAEKYAMAAAREAKARGVRFELRKIETLDQAKAAPAPFTAYTLFRDGAFVTNEILSEKKLATLFAAD
ncbi:GNAT family N-acetyltransferase [Raoultibacter timonensis]|nr:GNAT family N-acetyltransferase [Raoultibacter timonensis]